MHSFSSFDGAFGGDFGGSFVDPIGEQNLPPRPVGARLAEARAIAEAESRNWQTLSSSSDDSASVSDEPGARRYSPQDDDAQSAAFQLPADEPAVLYSGYAPFPVTDVNDLWLQACGSGRNTYGVQGAHLNPRGLFLCTSTPRTWGILSACLPS